MTFTRFQNIEGQGVEPKDCFSILALKVNVNVFQKEKGNQDDKDKTK